MSNDIQYLALCTFFLTALGICILMLSLSAILGGKSQARYKHTPFESGIDSVDHSDLNLSIKFYLVAIYFVLFDVEALYLYLWSISAIEVGWIGFVEVIVFVLFLLSGLIYLIRSNGLNIGYKSKPLFKKL
ncbi:NADH:ubiquinone oxidoreductase subunit A [Buchnera aphidicola (Schlechtendalia chinensis)]|uniref:NADH-quinone oxidoreductase subunit A n=1 Tax=Buchnera aphidicola subsp. Schlechtendalia chinensis TaxID=118110 RepID=A0A172WDB9_BUCSC|nr:NADH-quinone oxidoreductase subunit A [Buchnera aphidicola]ANF16951.1 NADH:ubiquinone oxidoreductase subunit A [Buchnera aphidicola (Schlechtendalia chinensis)]